MTDNYEMISKAVRIANAAHANQFDKGGLPYILHPIRVALHCQTDEEKVVAILHDVIEDTSVTLDDLKEEGFDDKVLEAIYALSRKENEEYMQFIERVAENQLAVRVKIQDLFDNMDVSRLNGRPHWKLETYKVALAYLKEKQKAWMMIPSNNI